MDHRWNSFAAQEPYFAVLTSDRYLRARLDRREFFGTGEDYVRALFRTIRQHFAPMWTASSILEFGCGPGRLAGAFAGEAHEVVAVDSSPAMLDEAGANLAQSGCTNVRLASGLRAGHRFDLINCYLVLQRVPRAEGMAIIRDLVERIRANGIGVFHVPFRHRATRLLKTSQWLRAHVPGANVPINLLRHRALRFPYFPTHGYDLSEVFAVLGDAGYDAPLVTLERHGDWETAVILVWKTREQVRKQALENALAPVEAPIDVRKLIESTSIEELNRSAESYFRSLDRWDFHLSKPFSTVDDAPKLLINAGVVLQGLRLVPGLTVLEYGAGSGWLSRYVTQLGCRAILLDVSETALRIARELYARQPVIGEQPAPEFLTFDARHIPLEDESVDRILCFDAFHHAPNPDQILRELARVLRPGGIAAFAEPGPHHSKTAQSQFEMRTYNVVENDVDIDAIWSSAQAAGFTSLRLAVFHLPPFHVTLEDYEDLLRGGGTALRWASETRTFLESTRNFFLAKGAEPPPDSRQASALSCSIQMEAPGPVHAGTPITVRVHVTNRGNAVWLPFGKAPGSVGLGFHIYDAADHLIAFDVVRVSLTEPPRRIEPGESVVRDVTLPPLDSGTYFIESDCVAERVAWFSQMESIPARTQLTVL